MRIQNIFILTLLFSYLFSQAQECASGNCYDGFGKNIYDNGQEYIGEFKNGIRHGYGNTIFRRGGVYIGEYSNGKRHGLGVFEWENGNRFVGNNIGEVHLEIAVLNGKFFGRSL